MAKPKRTTGKNPRTGRTGSKDETAPFSPPPPPEPATYVSEPPRSKPFFTPVRLLALVVIALIAVQLVFWKKGRSGRWEEKELTLMAEFGGPDPERGGLLQPIGVAVTAGGEVIVADAGRPEDPANTAKFVKFSRDGKVVPGFKVTGTDMPSLHSVVGLCADSKGEIVALDANPHGPKFIRFSADGKVRVIQSVGMYGPYSMTSDPDGHLWVSSLWGVSRHDAEAKDDLWLGKLGKPGSGEKDGEVNGPSCALRSPDGPIYVADRGNWRLQKFTSGGQFEAKWVPPRDKFPGVLRMLALDSRGKLYLSAENGGAIWVFDKALNPVAKCMKIGAIGMQNPLGLATDREGALYVADAGLRKILKFSAL